MDDISHADRYLNLAVILTGEALAALGNGRQRGMQPGNDTLLIQDKLQRAIVALQGPQV